MRLIRLALVYRRRAAVVIALQMVLLALALGNLGLVGLAVDVLGTHEVIVSEKNEETGETELVTRALLDKQPNWPFELDLSEYVATPLYQVFIIAGLALAIAVVRFFLDRTSTVAIAKLSQAIIVDLRSSVYSKLQRLGFSFFDANASGSIINRVTGDVQGVRMFVDGVMIPVLMLVISLTFFLGYMLSIHVWLTLACLATTPLLWILTAMFSKIVKPAYRENRRLFDNAVRVLSENVQGVHVVKGFSLQTQQETTFKEANEKFRDQQRWIFWRVSTFVPLIGSVTSINIVVLLVYGGYLFLNDPSFTQGTLMIFFGLLSQFSAQVGNIAQIANSVQRSLTSAQRVFEVLDTPIEIETPGDAKPLKRAQGRVEFDAVTFRYDENSESAVLTDLTFEAQPGQTIAILGATGAGKSTMLSMIPRFYDPQKGAVRIDGRDLREYDLDDLRRNVGLVFQESFLFSNTIAENIAFGHPSATREQIQQAAKIAQAHDFVMEMDNGYDTVIQESGANLSGGQRQRLALARALLLEPPILVLDDPTAAIDPGTENEIMAAMNAAMVGRTTFIVAHRLSTLKRADLVLVVEHGRIVQRGTHDELMAVDGHYRDVADLQIADEESKKLLGMHI